MIIRIHQDRAQRTIKTPLGSVDTRCTNGGAYIGKAEATGREFAGIDLHAHRRALATGETHHADAGNLR